MVRYINSADGLNIHYNISGTGQTEIIFVHGALGSTEWWNHQENYFADKYTIVLIDLPGHGKSDRTRKNWTAGQYADDIKIVAGQTGSQNKVLVGHSMSGAYVLEASLSILQVKAVILADTLKDLDQFISFSQAEQFIFSHYRKDFKDAVENMLPQYLFAETTHRSIQQRLQKEFLKNDPELAVNVLAPLYKMDIREIAKRVKVPVRSINSDFTPTNRGNNLKYFKDYDYVNMKGTGHYPMLEKPDEFNMTLESVLIELSI